MRLIRKGNDIGVVWSIYEEQDGSTVAHSLEGLNLSLFLESGKNRYEITDFTVSGNAMSFTFWGKDQIACGAYFLTLVENKGLEDMRVLDYKNAFAIVRHSWEAGGEDNPNITIETVELSSNIGEIIDERLIPNTIARVADVNALLAGYLPLSGGVMSGDVNMNGNYVSGVHAPIEDDDAVNKQYVDSEVGALDNSIQNLSTHISDMESSVGDIQDKIPSAASSSNQLADKAFVNSSIATSTATFRGTSPKLYTESTFLEWANAISSKDANDYVFWWTEDAAGNTVYKRYKYTGSGWLFEYDLNNSSFTAAQWAAINSLMTSALTGKLVELPTAQQLAASFNAKQNTLVSGENIKTINNQSLLGSGNIEIQGGGGTDNLFIAEYAVTRVSEIIDAYNAGKDIVAKKENGAGGYDFYQLLGYNDSAIQFDFYAIDDSTIKRIYIVDQGGETAEEEWGIGITTNLNKSDIFWATYNLTTLAQVQSAINSGKLVFVKVDGIALHCPGITSDVAVFTSFVLGYGYISVSLNSNGWEQAVLTNPEYQNNKVTSIGPASSNIQYPSAKAVYEALSGKQATINTVNVSVSNTTGTPSGTASVSGSTMNLSFSGIKGEKGDTGATGPQGPQGNTGSSVDYPFELVDNLTTDDPTKALSAAQGVVLEGEISQLGQEVTNIESIENPVSSTPVSMVWESGNIMLSTGEKGTSTTHVRTAQTYQAHPGDVISYKRTQGILSTTVYVLKYKNGIYIENQPLANNATPITVTEDCEYAFSIDKNNNESTAEERISVASASIKLFQLTHIPIVDAVKTLQTQVGDIIPGKIESTISLVDSLYKPGENLDSYIKTGKYYAIESGVAAIKSGDATAKYTDFIDVSLFRGQKISITVNNRRASSSRACGICNTTGQTTNYVLESAFIRNEDGSYGREILITDDFFFFSISSDATSISIDILEERASYTKEEERRIANSPITRYHFSFDDFILAFKDITENASSYNSIFENDTFAWMKSLHDSYGTVFSCYCFYTDGSSFDMSQCTDKFKADLSSCSAWLKFGFHSHDSSRSYASSPTLAGQDYEQLITELVRVTGSIACIDRLPRIHNYAGTKDAMVSFRDASCGIVGALTAKNDTEFVGRDSYYFTPEQNAYMNHHCKMYDADTQLTFFKTSFIPSTGAAKYISDIGYVNLRGQVEFFMHENQLTAGMKSTFEGYARNLSANGFSAYFAMGDSVNL